jgi:uncharacterized protein (TIGR00295 family)
LSTIPSDDDCIRILQESGTPNRVIRHTCLVMVLASAIAERCGGDIPLVRAGGLLHDLGRSRTHGVGHAVEGARLAREKGLPEAVVLIIQKHMGAGFTSSEAEEMGLPPGDYMPSTLEEKIVCHADNLVSGHSYMSSQQTYKEMVDKGYPATAERMRAMHAELSALCKKDIDKVVQEIEINKVEGPCKVFLADPNASY